MSKLVSAIVILALQPLSVWAQAPSWFTVPGDRPKVCVFVSNEAIDWWSGEEVRTLEACKAEIRQNVVVLYAEAPALGGTTPPFTQWASYVERGYMAFIPDGQDLKKALKCNVQLKRNENGELVPLPTDLKSIINQWPESEVEQRWRKFLEDRVKIVCEALLS